MAALSLWAMAQAVRNAAAGAAQLVALWTVGPASAVLGFWLCAWERAMITARAAMGSARNRGDRYIGGPSGRGLAHQFAALVTLEPYVADQCFRTMSPDVSELFRGGKGPLPRSSGPVVRAWASPS